MRLRFTKMHGAGNDFVMLDGISQKLPSFSVEKIRRIADRHRGVGCDQVLVVEAPQTPESDFRYRIFNQDGAEVENCGNGARCFALFVRQRGLTNKTVIRVDTAGGPLTLNVLDNNLVQVDMGLPVTDPESVPFNTTEKAVSYPLDTGADTYEISAISMGNPHAVTLVDDVDQFPVLEVGPLVEQHERFPEKVNAGFLQLTSRTQGKLRVYERGAGETLACGTGACAAMVTAQLRGLVDQDLELELRGGTLQLHWEGEGTPVIMTGPATTVFQGHIKI